MPSPKPETLTPVRSPMPPQRFHRRKSHVMASKGPGTAAAASSSEKETPTVVFTETSPFPNNDSGEKTAATGGSDCSITVRSTMTDKRLAAVAQSKPQPEKLFRKSQNSNSSSPGSKAEQTMADEDGSSSYSRRDEREGSRESTSATQNKNLSSEDSGDPKQQQVVSIVQNVLECGIASICRLRQLFPPSFFQKFDLPSDGTTLTMLNEEAIKRICSNTRDDDSSDDEDDEQSMLKSIDARTQKSLSPLTEMTQKRHKSSRGYDRAVYSDRERRRAMEALLLLRWMKKDGMDSLLREGHLASVVFGIWAPSRESGSNDSGAATKKSDVLIESYSFDISYMTPENPSEVETSEVYEGTGSFFQNLNGFQAGRSLSQSVVPSKTQGSCIGTQASIALSQASRATSQYGTQEMSPADQSYYGLSQKHHESQSQMAMSQKSLMASMSQSIHVSVKKNRGSKIPADRYLTLRCEFTKSLHKNELPSGLKERAPNSSCHMASPVPVGSGAMRVTPLGRITESSYSGLCVEMSAHSRVVESEEMDCDDNTVNFSQCSRSKEFSTQPQKETVANLTETGNNDEDISFCDDDGQVNKKECFRETSHSDFGSAGSQAISSQVKIDIKENVELQVGGKAFGLPYGLNCGETFLLCDVRDYRMTRSAINGRREEYKVAFQSNELKAAGKKKQWIMRSKLISFHAMSRAVEEALQKGPASAGVMEEIAQELKVDVGFVRRMAKKRESTRSHEKKRQFKKVKRCK